MSSELVSAKPCVFIPLAAAFQVKGDQTELIGQGQLYIVQAESASDCFVLQVGNFSYPIMKDMPVLASSNEGGALRSYALMDLNSYTIIKILSVDSLQMLANLDKFFADNTKFAEKGSNQQQQLPLVEEKMVVNEVVVKDGKEISSIKVSDLIYRGGDLIKNCLLFGAELLAQGIIAGGGYIQEKYLAKSADVNVGDSTMRVIEIIGTATGWAMKLKSSKLKQLTSYGKRIMFEAAKRRTQQDPNAQDGIRQIGSATIYGFINVYEGMMDAMDIVKEKGIDIAATNIVQYKYGEQAGTATRKILNSVRVSKKGQDKAESSSAESVAIKKDQ